MGRATIDFYHGGRDWTGPFVVNPKNSKVMEHGPGLYLTNGIETARHYARGGGVVQRISLDPDARLLNGVQTPVSVMLDFLQGSGIRGGKRVIADLERLADRDGQDTHSLSRFVNLMVNHKALTPSSAQPVNEFLVAQGADLDVFSAPLFGSAGSGNDQWVVVFNPDVVVDRVRVNMKEYDWSSTHLPTFEEQLVALGAQAAIDDPLAQKVASIGNPLYIGPH
jgi:hypothetical protein